MISNLFGIAGLAAIAVAVGALSGNWWWSAMAGGVFAVITAGVAQWNALRLPAAEPAVTADVPRLPKRRPA
jgi:uncharacterized membrane protein YccC